MFLIIFIHLAVLMIKNLVERQETHVHLQRLKVESLLLKLRIDAVPPYTKIRIQVLNQRV